MRLYIMKRRIIICIICIVVAVIIGAIISFSLLSLNGKSVYILPAEMSERLLGGTPWEFVEYGINRYGEIIDLNHEAAKVSLLGNLILVLEEEHKENWLREYDDFWEQFYEYGFEVSSDYRQVILPLYHETTIKALLLGFNMDCFLVNQLLNGESAWDLWVEIIIKDAGTGEVVSSSVWPKEGFSVNTKTHSYTSINDAAVTDEN